MYRLHNLGIEPKIDWLVKNRKLTDKKIIISPWNDDSIRLYNYLTRKYGIRGEKMIIVDDEIS